MIRPAAQFILIEKRRGDLYLIGVYEAFDLCNHLTQQVFFIALPFILHLFINADRGLKDNSLRAVFLA